MNPMLEIPKDTIDRAASALEAAFKFLQDANPELADQVGTAWGALCEFAEDAEATES